jgi:hypothetical protein
VLCALCNVGQIIENISDCHQKAASSLIPKRKKAYKPFPGPLVCFEGLLSLYGNEVKMVNDMIVAVEDLRSVEFTLMPVEKKRTGKKAAAAAAKSRGSAAKPGDGPTANIQGGGTTVRWGTTESKISTFSHNGFWQKFCQKEAFLANFAFVRSYFMIAN